MRRLGIGAALTAIAAAWPATAAEFRTIEECSIGRRVMDRENRAGAVVELSNGMCTIALDGGERRSYLHWMLRAEGASTKSADALVPGIYTCYASGNYLFMDIIIEGPTSYRDKAGKTGTYRQETSGRILFESGPFAGYNAALLAGPRIGLNSTGGSFYATTCGLKK